MNRKRFTVEDVQEVCEVLGFDWQVTSEIKIDPTHVEHSFVRDGSVEVTERYPYRNLVSGSDPSLAQTELASWSEKSPDPTNVQNDNCL